MKKIIACGLFAALPFTANATLIVGNTYTDSAGASWEYVGSWQVSDGPSWSLSPGTNVMFNGLEAAEHIFGSLAPGYVYATASNDSGLVDHMANYDGWGVSTNTVLPENFQADKDLDGEYEHYSPAPWDYTTSDMSAYISDHGNRYVNYAFVGLAPIASVPEPSAMALLGLGLAGLGFSRRKKSA